MAYPSDCSYTKDHEWVRVVKNVATIGITDYAQKQLGDVVLVELPQIGSTVEQGDPCGTIESVKAVAEFYAPVRGKIGEINEELNDSPETVNDDPYGEGWLFRMQVSDTSQLKGLLTASQYEDYIKEEASE